MTTNLEQQLWNIYSYYSLHGNPTDPEHMTRTSFTKFCRDCHITEHPDMTVADIGILYQAEVKRKTRATSAGGLSGNRENSNLLTHSDFLNLLLRIACRVYQGEDQDMMMKKLLVENVFPYASRRLAHDILLISREVSEDPEIHHLCWVRFGPALRQIFDFYRALSDLRRKKVVAMELQIKNNSKHGHGQIVITSARDAQALKIQRGRVGYKEIMQFCQDYKITTNSLLTTIEVGDAYLNTVQGRSAEDDFLVSLDAEEFLELLIRLALRAYSNADPSISLTYKLKGFFLLMWRNVTKEERAGVFLNSRGRSMDSVKGKGGDLNICGSSLFNQVMLDVWREDDYRDYMDVNPDRQEDAREVLKRMTMRAEDLIAAGYNEDGNEVGGRHHTHTRSLSHDRERAAMTSRGAAVVVSPPMKPPKDGRLKVKAAKKKVRVSAEQVRDLLLKKPDLGDILYQAIREMELEEEEEGRLLSYSSR